MTLTQLSSWGTSLNHLLAPGFTPFRIVSFYLRPPTSDQRLCLKDDDPIIINIGAGRDPTPTAQPGNSPYVSVLCWAFFFKPRTNA